MQDTDKEHVDRRMVSAKILSEFFEKKKLSLSQRIKKRVKRVKKRVEQCCYEIVSPINMPAL